MFVITIDDSPRRELIIIALAIEALTNASVIFLAFDIPLSVFHQNALCRVIRRFPEVAIISIEVPFVESKFGKKHGTPCELVIIGEQRRRIVVDEDKDV